MSTIAILDHAFVQAQFPAFAESSLAGQAFFENAGGSYACGRVIELLAEYSAPPPRRTLTSWRRPSAACFSRVTRSAGSRATLQPPHPAARVPTRLQHHRARESGASAGAGRCRVACTDRRPSCRRRSRRARSAAAWPSAASWRGMAISMRCGCSKRLASIRRKAQCGPPSCATPRPMR